MQEVVVDPEESTVEGLTEEVTETQETTEVEKELKESQGSEFRGMDFNTLQESYTQLERRMSQQGQELGELRQLADTSLKKQPEDEVDFFEDPDAAVSKAIDGNQRLRTLEQRTEQMAELSARTELTRRHPDYLKIDQSPEFAKWIESSRARQRLYVDASQNLDVEIADELMVMYKESTANQSAEADKLEGERKDTLKAVKSDSGSTGGTTTKKIFRRADLMQLQNTDPDKYDEMYPEIEIAYTEGRVR